MFFCRNNIWDIKQNIKFYDTRGWCQFNQNMTKTVLEKSNLENVNVKL